MGKASRLHRQAVIAGTELPIRHEKWKPTPRLIKGWKLVSVTAEALAKLKEGAPNVSK